MDTPQQQGDPPGQGFGEHHAHRRRHHADYNGNGPQVVLNALEQGPLLSVVLIEVNRSLSHGTVGHRNRRPAAQRPVLILRSEHIIALQSRDNFPDHGILASGIRPLAALLKVTQHQAVGIGDHHPGHPQAAQQQADRLCGSLLCQGLRPGSQGGSQHRGLVLQGGLLGLVGQSLGHHHRIGVEQYHHRRHNDQIGHGVLNPEGSPEGHSSGPLFSLLIIHSSNNSPRPTW